MSARPDAAHLGTVTSYTGSSSERQSVGLPGHCDRCAALGHVKAHPNLGCTDVGCYSAHDEPAPQDPSGPNAPGAAAIPDTVLLFNALRPHATPVIFTDMKHGGIDKVTVHLFHAIREHGLGKGAYDRPPIGVLYTATGAHRLDEVLATMWNDPASDALRQMPTDHPYTDPHLALQEETQQRLDQIWGEFRGGLG